MAQLQREPLNWGNSSHWLRGRPHAHHLISSAPTAMRPKRIFAAALPSAACLFACLGAFAFAPTASAAAVAAPPVGVWTAGDKSTLLLTVNTGNGGGVSYTVDAAGERWLASGPIKVTSGGKRLSTADGTLALTSSTTVKGSDALGPFTGLVLRWAPAALPGDGKGPAAAGGASPSFDAEASVLMETAFLMSADGTNLRFNTTFPSGVAGASGGHSTNPTSDAWGVPSSAFPSFKSGAAGAKLGAGLGYVSYGEIGRPRGGVFPSGFKSGSNEEDGVPLALLDRASGTAAMLSPSASFFDTVFSFAPDESAMNGGVDADVNAGVGKSGSGVLKCGVIGTADSIPAGWQTQVILHFNNTGLSSTVLGWGDAMLALHGKSRPAPDATVQIGKLGLSTVGHYFYGAEINKTMEETLNDLVKQCGLPYAYVLIDSFWYREGPVPTPSGGQDAGFGGTWRWDDVIARAPEMFPSGLAALKEALGVPFVMHMGEWVGSESTSGAPPYAANKSYDWVVESRASLPRAGSEGGRRFWDDLFAGMAAAGLDTYKLDHSQQQMPAMTYLLTTIGATAGWLADMAVAAAKHGVHKQYGGHISSGFLHSVQLPNAVVARVSDDYIPGKQRPPGSCGKATNEALTPEGNTLMARNSLYTWAIGLVPYKDAFLSGPQRWDTTTCAQSASYTKPEWWGLQEANPELNVVVATLSAGPVAPGDGVGDTDAALVMRSCAADGTLLKPDRPALALDAVWERFVFGTGGASGEISHTGTSLDAPGSPFGWHHVLAIGVTSPYTVNASDLVAGGGFDPDTTVVAWSRPKGGRWQAPKTVDVAPRRASRLQLAVEAASDFGDYTLWHTAAVSCGGAGWTLLGEFGKVAPVSRQRFVGYTEACAGAADNGGRIGGAGGGVGAGPGLEVRLAGGAGETVSVAFLPPRSTTPQVVTSKLDQTGAGLMRVPPAGWAQA